ncbi:hypothetical protein BJX99DRAFT_240470 [Aspergillus californicus]
MAAIVPDLEVGGSVNVGVGVGVTQSLLEKDECDYDYDYDSYSWVLLEDHPLRSYPTAFDCHPDIASFTRKFYTIARRRWRERVVPLLCLVLMFFVVVQFLVLLPHVADYFLETGSELETGTGFIQQIGVADAGICVFDNDETLSQSQMEELTDDAIEYALASGCTGIKVNLWLRNNELFVDSNSNLKNTHTLQTTYLQPLQAKLDARNSASSDKTDNEVDDVSPVGLFDESPLHPFTLLLEIKTPMRMAWPRLVSQLEGLNERGYLSYRDATHELVRRPVTVVVGSRGKRRLSLWDDLLRTWKRIV